ncbi:MAG: flagellar hook protein FlgE [Leptospiraceae bacterium]|nr:flagellar hook protein FlgE [Leptospiraceae bacterium]MDW8307373.1 flagellar hook protein FlgE [Leptospiraceae bacterium]
MMRTLYAGVSGLKNHQIRMDVVSNNIANVNTTGFKAERVNFQDMISQLIQGAAEPKANIGGVNPKQVGLGAMVAAIDKLMTQGALQTTGKNTDLAITGEGFFILKDGDKQFFTRAGAFDVDKDGNFVNPANGMKVQGWNARKDPTGKRVVNPAGEIEDIVIPLYEKEPAKETTFVRFKSNLNSAVLPIPAGATDAERYNFITAADPNERRGHLTTIVVYDDQGREQTLKVFMWKSDVNKWTASVSMTQAEQLTVDVLGPAGQNTTVPGNTRFELFFTPDGKLVSVSDGTDSKNDGSLTAQISFRLPGNPAVRNIELRLGTAGEVDGITQFASQFTTKAVEQDGYTMGYLESFVIDPSGVITGIFSNGVQQPLAQVALANFTNPEGLNKAGENNFQVSNNSGEPIIGEAGVAGLGKINAGFLEMSNVDLADQFTDMIVTQRGFQANSRSITTADQMIQELLGLKR